MCFLFHFFFFFQAEDGIRDLVRSRGLGDVYKRQLQTVGLDFLIDSFLDRPALRRHAAGGHAHVDGVVITLGCLLYTSDAADERSSVDLGGRRIIKKKKSKTTQTKRGKKKKHNK